MQDILARCIDWYHAVLVEFVAVPHHPEELAAIARADPAAGHCRAFRRIPAQECLDLLYPLLRHDGLPCVIADTVCKLVQNAANRQ